MGNFLFPNESKIDENDTWFWGYITRLNLYIDGLSFVPIPYRFCVSEGQIKPLRGVEKDNFDSYIRELNEIIKSPDELKTYFEAWSLYAGEKYAKRLLWNDSISASERAMKQTIEIQNLFRCEAHREMMQVYFELWSQGRQSAYKEKWEEIKALQDYLKQNK